MIRTPEGDVAIENLSVGDIVIAPDGGRRAISWIGSRRVVCAGAAKPERLWPVRIKAGAFADKIPARDLYLSAGHCILPPGAEVLIPIGHLVNGESVAHAPCDEVTYWHVELDRHDLVLAEGLGAESFLDVGTGDRNWFATVSEPPWSRAGHTKRTYADMKVPYFKDWGPVDTTKALLAARSIQAA